MVICQILKPQTPNPEHFDNSRPECDSTKKICQIVLTTYRDVFLSMLCDVLLEVSWILEDNAAAADSFALWLCDRIIPC